MSSCIDKPDYLVVYDRTQLPHNCYSNDSQGQIQSVTQAAGVLNPAHGNKGCYSKTSHGKEKRGTTKPMHLGQYKKVYLPK